MPVIACTPVRSRQLSLSWGVSYNGRRRVTETLFNEAVNAARRAGYVEDGIQLYLLRAFRLQPPTTNLIKVVRVGE